MCHLAAGISGRLVGFAIFLAIGVLIDGEVISYAGQDYDVAARAENYLLAVGRLLRQDGCYLNFLIISPEGKT
jgi:hypothetical protein